uniref:Ankyrin repeat-containing protein n=1 Tax=Trepomonas sp. PC1 TaxID=1076344 RepID=A0A146KJB2_9EUKA|eukprot:JAP95944.1 hypothetical protein TPC1_10885 [Trepomonas sp. PC1]
MQCCSAPIAKWFDYARTGDIDQINDNIELGKNRVDQRKPVPDEVFPGFCAIHYAAMFGHHQVVQLLLPDEAGQLTKQTQKIKAPGISNYAMFNLAVGSNCLMIALLADQRQVIRVILDYIQENPSVFTKISLENEFRFTNFSTACCCRFAEAYEILRNQIFQQEMYLVLDGDLTPVMLACTYLNIEFLNVCQSLLQTEDFKQSIQSFFELSSSGKNVLEICQGQNIEKLGVSEQEQQEFISKLKQLIKIMAKQAQTSDFLKDKKLEEWVE